MIMINDNEIVFKNPRIEELIDRERSETMQYGKYTTEAKELFKKKSVQEIGEAIIAGYWSSLLVDAMMDDGKAKAFSVLNNCA